MALQTANRDSCIAYLLHPALCLQIMLSVSAKLVQELSGLAEWQQPKAGMFIWLKLLAGVRDLDDIAAELVEANVMILPGAACMLSSPLTSAACCTAEQFCLSLCQALCMVSPHCLTCWQSCNVSMVMSCDVDSI